MPALIEHYERVQLQERTLATTRRLAWQAQRSAVVTICLSALALVVAAAALLVARVDGLTAALEQERRRRRAPTRVERWAELPTVSFQPLGEVPELHDVTAPDGERVMPSTLSNEHPAIRDERSPSWLPWRRTGLGPLA